MVKPERTKKSFRIVLSKLKPGEEGHVDEVRLEDDGTIRVPLFPKKKKNVLVVE